MASDWLGPDAAVDLSAPEAQARAVRIVKSAAWIVRMHVALHGHARCDAGVSPPRIAWDEMVAELKGSA